MHLKNVMEVYSHKLYILFLYIRGITHKTYCEPTSMIKSNSHSEGYEGLKPSEPFLSYFQTAAALLDCVRS